MHSPAPSIYHLAAGLPRNIKDERGRTLHTGIRKKSVSNVFLHKSGFHGDDVADKKNHGGPDRAVCIYPWEHYRKWEAEFETDLEQAAFGENLTVTHMREENVYIGNIYKAGTAMIQVTQGRIPCDTVNRRTGIPELMNRMIETGFTGYLCRVLQEGEVCPDSQIELVEEEENRISVLYANYTYFHDRKNLEAVEDILKVKPLADKWRSKLEKRRQTLM
ncbi:MOSC domain-containing protein [Salibacterium sp. K-3]